VAKYILRRLIQLIPTLFGVYTLAFLLMRVLPGDAASFLAGFRGSAEALANLRAKMQIDQPILTQYVSFLGRSLSFDFGNSYITGQPVTEMISSALPITLRLALVAMLIAIGIGIPLGVVSALKKNSLIDNLARIFAVLAASLPTYWLAMQFQINFGLYLKWFPISGTPTAPSGFDNHIVLPALALAFTNVALLTRMSRSSLLDELNNDYIRTANSKGLRSRRVVWVHAFRNALLPIITVWGLSLADLLTGALLVELIFSLPGMGRLLVQSINTRDYPLLQANMIILAIAYTGTNLLVDVLYMIIDPRIRYD
jgi:peptide/nickel transport system permease protein